jgi:hypothetical protein
MLGMPKRVETDGMTLPRLDIADACEMEPDA